MPGREELYELNSILNSKPFLSILDEHRRHIIKSLHEAVRDKNIIIAYGEICKLDNTDRILGLVKLRITEIEKGEKENGS